MGPSPAKPDSEKTSGTVEQLFYGVYLPPDVQPPDDTDNSIVFEDKSEALKLVKKYKKARFKAFRSMNDAMQFAVFGPENISVFPTSTPEAGEKPSPFRGPKPQDMVRFRKAIEAGDLEFVKMIVWENPRYLVSSGDTPAILQEGSRYNALHIGAKSKDSAMCAFVLQTISSVEFMRHFYGDSSTVDTEQRCDVLLDLYLNTPDKAMNETPLHFAAKFGAARVVQVLVTYPQCDTTLRNKFQQTAKDVICSRTAGGDTSLREEIAAMLEGQFYVPVLRSPDNSIQPTVGKPFSPSSPIQQQQDRQNDVTSPTLEVQAVAGPMPKQTAELFRRRWKTPPRLLGFSGLIRRPTLTDQDKGWEKVGRELAQEWKVPWKEYWPFLETYIDLSSPEGLQMLEDYLRMCFKNTTVRNESNLSDVKDSLSTPTTPTPTSTLTQVRQANGILSPESPVSELCNALQSCRLSSGDKTNVQHHYQPHHRNSHHHNSHVRHDDTLPTNIGTTSPHLYMEKSCQVFAKRIADGFLLFESELEFLWVEIKHLNVLVSSCKSDNRFSQLDFQRLHSRLGCAIAHRLDTSELPRIVQSLNSIINRRKEDCYYSSDEEDYECLPYSKRQSLDRVDKLSLHAESVCLVQAILSAVSNSAKQNLDQLDSEQACADAWAHAQSCSCAFVTDKPFRKKYSSQKKLNFKDCGLNEESSVKCKFREEPPPPCSAVPADSSGEESDTSDTSDCEFFTPPSSPGVRSDEDQAMESPDEGPDVYISGNTPSKLDLSVMEAIEGSELNKAKFPNICRWRHLVLLHSQAERQSWLSSPKHKMSPGTPTMWHRAPSLHRD